MKSTPLLVFLEKYSFYFICAFLMMITFTDPFNTHLNSYLVGVIDSITLSLSLALELKTLAASASASHIPLVSGTSANANQVFGEVMKYLSWSDLLVTIQLVLLNLSTSMLFKITMLFAIGITLIPKYRSMALKILVVLFLINPGLGAFVYGVKYIANVSQISIQDDLAKELQSVHEKYKEKETMRNQKQQEKAEDDASIVANKVEEGVSEGYLVLKEASKELVVKSINLLVSVLVQFILLPFVFFYGASMLFKRLTSATVSEQFTQKLLAAESLGIMILGVTLLTSCGTSSSPVTNESPANDTTVVTPDTTTKKESITPALGIDVSHFQGDINWEEILSADITFAYTKATQGIGYVDTRFKDNWQNAASAGIRIGAYHFYTSDNTGKEQADHFINTIKEVNKGEMPPVIDLEQGGISGTIDKASFITEVKTWLDMVEKEWGVKPIIYTNTPFANEYLNDPHFANYKLWIAEYGVSTPKIPSIWKEWHIWQRTPKGAVEGEIGNVDHDITKVSLDDLIVQ